MNKLKFHLNGRLLTWQVFERDWSDYLTFVVMSPVVRTGLTRTRDVMDAMTHYKEYSFEATTKFSWSKSDHSWSLVVRFMGFGIQIFRQTGY